MSDTGAIRSGSLASTTSSLSSSLPTSRLSQRTLLPSHSRISSQQRPYLSARASSLGISTKVNLSSPNFGSSVHVGSSGLKQEVPLSPPVTDSLAALETIVMPAESKAKPDQTQLRVPKETFDIMDPEINFGNLSLQEFIGNSKSSKSTATVSLSYSMSSSPGDCFDQVPSILHTLHQSIGDCDRLLESVQLSLGNLQKDLGTVSSEIETLQARSHGINEQLGRRRVVENFLGSALENVSVPPAVVLKLSKESIDQDWATALAALDRRLDSFEDSGHLSSHVSQDSDLQLLLRNLRDMSIERIRDYFVLQIRALRSPKVNAQALQQQAFLPFKELFKFLAKHQPRLANEMTQAYSNTMRWYYLSGFARYKDALERVSLLHVNRNEVLGAEASNAKGPQPALQTTQKAAAPFLLGHRSNFLSHHSKHALPLYVVAEMKKAVYIETPFSTITTAITDNASAEYTFLTSFLPGTLSFAALPQAFTTIFEPVFKLAHSFTRYLTGDTVDCLGLLLCIRVMQQHAFTLQRRRCPLTEGWVNQTNMLLWPRFQGAMDAHVASLRRATASLGSGSRAALSLTLNGVDEGKGSVAPTPITQQFAQLLQGLLALSASDERNKSHAESTLVSSDAEPVGRSLERLRKEFQAFLLKASKGMNQSRRGKFLSNNYSLIKTIVGDYIGVLANEQREWIEEQIVAAEMA